MCIKQKSKKIQQILNQQTQKRRLAWKGKRLADRIDQTGVQIGIYLINIILMSKDQTVTKASNLFSMASFETQCRLPDIQVDFTAPFNLNKTSNSIVPAFCKDRKFFTPAFILPRDKEYYQANLCFERKFFQLRVRTAEARSLSYALNSQKQVRIDVIGPEEKCCQICRIKFESYIDHIQEDTHIKGIESNTTKNYIMQLCGKYQEQLKKGQDQRKRKTIKKRKQRKVLFSKADSLPQKVTRRAKK